MTVLFYGLFMDAEVLRAADVHPANPRRASVPGFALRIAERATLVREPAAVAHGLLMDLPDEQVGRLYAAPDLREYRAHTVVAVLDDGARIPAVCFNLPPPTDSQSRGPRNEEYARRLRELARSLGLPSDYVGRI